MHVEITNDREYLLRWLCKPAIWAAACGSIVGIGKPEDVVYNRHIIFFKVMSDDVECGFIAYPPWPDSRRAVSMHCSLATHGKGTIKAVRASLEKLKAMGVKVVAGYYPVSHPTAERFCDTLGFVDKPELKQRVHWKSFEEYAFKELEL
jgi:hypothetical protein